MAAESLTTVTAGHASLTDVIVIAIGGLTLLTTFVLSLIGIYIALESMKLRGDVESLKQSMKYEKDRLFGLRASAVTVGDFVGEAHVAIDILRRATENILTDRAIGPARLAAFKESIGRPLERLSRLEHYLRLLRPYSDETFEESLRDFCARFPDAWTVRALRQLADLLPEEHASLSRKAALSLEAQIQPYDARRWTG